MTKSLSRSDISEVGFNDCLIRQCQGDCSTGFIRALVGSPSELKRTFLLKVRFNSGQEAKETGTNLSFVLQNGQNDILKAIPVGIKEFKNFSIFNRWGQLVFQTANAARGWDGKLSAALQNGVFVWMAEGTDQQGNTIKRKGTVLLIR